VVLSFLPAAGKSECMFRHPMNHIGCMTVLNLTWFRAQSLPCLRRSGFAQAGARGEGDRGIANSDERVKLPGHGPGLPGKEILV